MLDIFGHIPGQIARTPAEIRPYTKAYVGSLVHKYPNGKIIPIFQYINHIEHIYTQFPEQKIRRTTVKIGGKTNERL